MRRSFRLAGLTAAGALAVAAVPFLATSSAHADTWTGGDLVVYRVGNGSAGLTNAAAPVFLDSFHAAGGAPFASLALPTTTADGNKPLTAAGLSRSEGQLTRSADGHYLAVTGYAATPGTTGPSGTSLTASDKNTVGRVVGIVDANGGVDTSTVLTGSKAPTIIRSAVTDGSRYWATGDKSGIVGAAFGGTPAVIAGSASDNLNGLSVQSGQLFTSGLLTHRLSIVGSGVPTSSASFADLPAAPTTNEAIPANLLTYGYAFVDRIDGTGYAGTTLDTLYVANASNRNGTLDKYSFNGTNWVAKGSIDVPGIQGLVANKTGTNPNGAVELAITTPTALLAKTDSSAATGTLTAGAPTTLATAGANTEFRGVALAPTGTNGPVAFYRSPAASASVPAGTAISASANVLGAVTGVTFKLGTGTPVAATKGAGNVWTASIPTTGKQVGSYALELSATDGTTTVTQTRTVAITAPTGSVGYGTYAIRNTLFKRAGTWATFSTTYSPDKKGLYTATAKRSITGYVYGSKLVLTFQKRTTAGKVYLIVDGKSTLIDLYGTSTSKYTKTFTFTGALKKHSFVIKVAGTKRSASKGKYVYAAAVQVVK
ncbi:hypothetical protein [Nocardioides marmorisolisilvae]|uniref:hypothetical protein n=1 Tax=Nocardioides marmorisolisilvae TaxID=1542737 RepID=UPI0011CDC700|nr:hypothetical protein [Nocardioides marmorisolisilvae]